MIFPLISNMSSQVHRGKIFLIISLPKSHLHPMNFEFFLHSYTEGATLDSVSYPRTL